MATLVLRLEGPLMAFGDVSVDERSPIRGFPALSMIVGLAGNALGLRRTEGALLQELQDTAEIASRVDRRGHRLRDFQTAQLQKKSPVWRSSGIAFKERGGGGNTYDNPTLLERDFWADASVTVALAVSDARADKLEAAFVEPARPLFLGRAACPPTAPILAGRFDGDVLEAILAFPGEPDAAAEREAQWPERFGERGRCRHLRVPDTKDWANGIHFGDRGVYEGVLEIGDGR